MPRARVNYLIWMKNLLANACAAPGYCDLASSGMQEPAKILEEILSAMDSGVLRMRLAQANPWGNQLLIAAVARRYGLPVEHVLLTGGVSAAIYLVCRTLVGRGDEVIVERPVYEPLLAAPQAQGACLVRLRRHPGRRWDVDTDRLDARITSRTRLIVLSNLHNPSGALLTEERLRGLAELARRHNAGRRPAHRLRILVDEVFHDFAADRQRPAATLDEAFISLGGLSKVYGLGMLRCGWILAAPHLIKAIRQTHILLQNSESGLTQALAAIVLEHAGRFDAHWRAVLSRNRRAARESIQPLIDEGLLEGALPEAGCVYFPKVTGEKDSAALVRHLAERCRVLVVPGRFFGASSHVRIGLGGPTPDLRQGLERLAEGLRARTGNA